MNPKNTTLLVLLTAGLFAFIFLFERHLHKAGPVVARVLPAFKPEEVTAVQVFLPRLKIRVERTNQGWQLTEPLVYPAESALIESLLQAAAELSPQTHISAEELKDHPKITEEYGFDNPQATIVFQQGEEKPQLKLGRLTAPGDQMYAQVVGLDRIDIIDADFFKKFVPREPDDWRDPSFINLNGQSFDQLTVANGAQGFIVKRETNGQPWHMFKPWRTRADYPKIDALLGLLQNLRVTHFVADGDHADLEAYGLQPPALELKFDQGTNPVLSVQFGKSPTNDSRQIYARCNGQNTVVLVPRGPIAPWQTNAEEFRDRHLVRFAGGPPDVIEVSSGPENFTVEHQTNDAWRVTRPVEFTADTNAMRAFLAALAGLEVVRLDNRVAVNDAALPDPDFVKYGLVKPAREYVMKRLVPAGASNAVLAELDFGLVKDGNVFVRRADLPEETSVYAVREADFGKLPANSLQLRMHRIWDFTEDDVSSITIRQNGQEQKIIHKGPNQWSLAPGSQGFFNPLEDEVAAQELGLLEAMNWVEAGDQNRARYGFSGKSPRISVEAKAHGKLQILTLDIGFSPGGLRYGVAKMDDGQNWIFDFSPDVLGKLVTYLNLQDHAIP